MSTNLTTTTSTTSTSPTTTTNVVPLNETQAAGCFSMLPEEKIIQIFGLFDCQTLGRIAQVCKYFEQLQKDDMLWIVKFGSNLMDQCVLDLRKKTITILSPWPGLQHCLSAINYPAIPKGSFVACCDVQLTPFAVIKERTGSVTYFTTLEDPSVTGIDEEQEHMDPDRLFAPLQACPVVLEFRRHIGKPTQYDCFKIIAPNPKSMKEGYVEAQQLLALGVLQKGRAGTYESELGFVSVVRYNLKQWRRS